MNIFRKIIDTRSITVIDYLAEDAMDQANDMEKQVLCNILECGKLDEKYALAHDFLGDHAEAKRLRDYVAAQRAKPKEQHLILLAD